jgi:hypothetical protein
MAAHACTQLNICYDVYIVHTVHMSLYTNTEARQYCSGLVILGYYHETQITVYCTVGVCGSELPQIDVSKLGYPVMKPNYLNASANFNSSQ